MVLATAKREAPATALSEPALMEIVIVNVRGGRELLVNCLRSIARHPLRAGAVKTWVVDNASGDGTVELIGEGFPWVELEALDRNAGFSAANNRALRRTRAPYVLLLNPDTEVREGALDRMLEVMEEDPGIGIAGCRLVRPDGSFDHAAKRSFPTPIGALAHFLGIGTRPGAPRPLQQYGAPELGEFDRGEVDAVNGAFMLVRRQALEQVGLLDEGYWLYMEDLDWCYRFKQRGWKVWYEGNTTVLHVKGGTSVCERRGTRHRRFRHNLAFHRSMARFYRKFYSGRPLDIVIYLAIGAKLLVSATRSGATRAFPA
jgi:N-acetylglucosaminyl-diphospho-decaprenol L-rhamnosyltransferase